MNKRLFLLGQYLLLRPGSTAGVQLPRGHFDQLAGAAAGGGPYPPWLAGVAHQRWRLKLPATATMHQRVLVRDQSEYGYGRASWEINLGCNYACSHCYETHGEEDELSFAEIDRILAELADAGTLFLTLTGGEFFS